MDRNPRNGRYAQRAGGVALRKESVDRNKIALSTKASGLVALRKESVDRNTRTDALWRITGPVALRKESVDRNSIERIGRRNVVLVALRKESVDRNVIHAKYMAGRGGRSPQGERG